MENNELLQAIGQMMDEKLEVQEKRTEEKFLSLRQEMGQIRREMSTKQDLEPIHKKLDDLAFQMDTVYKWVDRIDVDVAHIKKG